MPRVKINEQKIIANKGSTVSNVVQKITHVYKQSEIELLNEYLAKVVSAFETRMYQYLTRRPTRPSAPYKFLDSFDIEDRSVFFGREKAALELEAAILRSRLTILHARSGIGKTSLINAGISGKFIQNGYLPVYARAYKDPLRSIKQAICSHSFGAWPELLGELSLHEFLGFVCSHLSRDTKELLIVLDQFEEHYVFWPELMYRQPFIQDVAICLSDKLLPIRLLISIRKDYYSDLADFREFIPTIFHNEYRLDVMNRNDARKAIVNPLKKIGREVTYQDSLVEYLLDDLFTGGLELPHLQIVCTKLFENKLDDQNIISKEVYDTLGQAKGILTGYLTKVLDELPSQEREISQEILKELVSSEATKRVLTHDALKRRLHTKDSIFEKTLVWLVNARLIRRYEDASEIVYEMAHEYLIEEIKKWIDQSDLSFKQAQELLNREVASWRVHGTLIPKDRLDLILANWKRLVVLDKDSHLCLLSSVLVLNLNIAEWEKLIGDNSVETEGFLLDLLLSTNQHVKLAAIQALGSVWGLPDMIGLGDIRPSERQRSSITLGSLGDPRTVLPLIASLNDKDRNVRKSVVWALDQLNSPLSIQVLSDTLTNKGEFNDIREAAVYALAKLPHPITFEALINTLLDSDEKLQSVIINIMGELREPKFLESLTKIMELGVVSLEGSLIEAFTKIGEIGSEILIDRLTAKESYQRKIALVVLASIWGIPDSFEFVSEDVNIRKKALTSLEDSKDSRSLLLLNATLLDSAPIIRICSIEILKRIGKGDVGGLIEPLTQDHDLSVRLTAINALGAIGGGDVESLIEPLTQDHDLSVRLAAINALGAIGGVAATKCLISKLTGGNKEEMEEISKSLLLIGQPVEKGLLKIIATVGYEVRLVALRILGGILDRPDITQLGSNHNSDRVEVIKGIEKGFYPYAFKLLVSMLQDEPKDVKEASIYALGRLGNPKVIETFADLIRDDKSIWIPFAVAEALGNIQHPKSIEMLTSLAGKDDYVRLVAIESIRKLGGSFQGIPEDGYADNNENHDLGGLLPWVENLKDSNRYVRESAVRVLGDSRSPFAVKPLIGALRDEDVFVALEAIHSLSRLGARLAIDPLVEILMEDNDVLRRAAATALGKIGDEKTIAPLTACLRGYDQDVINAASEALQQIEERLKRISTTKH